MFQRTNRVHILGDSHRHYRRRPAWVRRMATLAALGVALFYVTWAMGSLNGRTRIRQALVDISRIEHAARLFRADHGRCPDNVDELFSPPGEQRYIAPLVDPWGRSYVLECPSSAATDGLQVMSGGPDGLLSGEDNIESL